MSEHVGAAIDWMVDSEHLVLQSIEALMANYTLHRSSVIKKYERATLIGCSFFIAKK